MAQQQSNWLSNMANSFVNRQKPPANGQQQQQQNNQQQQNGQQQNNGQQNNGQQQQQNNNGTNNNANSPENQKTPFDAYAKLWENADKSGEGLPSFNVDSKLINDTAGAMDFLSGLPEDLQEGMRTAFGEHADVVGKLLNHVGRRAYGTSISHGTALTDKYLNVSRTFDEKGLPKRIREHLTLTGLASHEAAQKHPVVRQTMEMVGRQLSNLYPDATPQWLQEKTIEFVKELSGAFGFNAQQQDDGQPRHERDTKSAGGQDFNWDEWTNKRPGNNQRN